MHVTGRSRAGKLRALDGTPQDDSSPWLGKNLEITSPKESPVPYYMVSSDMSCWATVRSDIKFLPIKAVGFDQLAQVSKIKHREFAASGRTSEILRRYTGSISPRCLRYPPVKEFHLCLISP